MDSKDENNRQENLKEESSRYIYVNSYQDYNKTITIKTV